MSNFNCIVIRSGKATPRIIKKKDGTQMIFNEQRAAIETGEEFPRPFTINLQEGQNPFPPGNYVLDPASLEVGDFDSLKVGRRIELIRLPDPAPAK
ncbi:single-stranded DNA-binding protein [Thermomonas sp.]|uniref:single-stranded DNA-binding protein n=1 Tax=Thermomonas sp. TaxID=1971895 RepID=UPI0035AD8105